MSDAKDTSAVDTRQHRLSWRLTFSFDGTTVRLAKQQTIEKIAPASVGESPKAGRHSGAWLELRDGRDRLLFVRRLYNPFQTLAEHHSPDGKIEVHLRPPQRGQFDAIVPAIEQARFAVLMSSPPSDGRSTEPAREMGRFDLGQKPEGEAPDKIQGGPTQGGPSTPKPPRRRGRRTP